MCGERKAWWSEALGLIKRAENLWNNFTWHNARSSPSSEFLDRNLESVKEWQTNSWYFRKHFSSVFSFSIVVPKGLKSWRVLADQFSPRKKERVCGMGELSKFEIPNYNPKWGSHTSLQFLSADHIPLFDAFEGVWPVHPSQLRRISKCLWNWRFGNSSDPKLSQIRRKHLLSREYFVPLLLLDDIRWSRDGGGWGKKDI